MDNPFAAVLSELGAAVRPAPESNPAAATAAVPAGGSAAAVDDLLVSLGLRADQSDVLCVAEEVLALSGHDGCSVSLRWRQLVVSAPPARAGLVRADSARLLAEIERRVPGCADSVRVKVAHHHPS